MYKHGLWTPNEDINLRNLKLWADVVDKICFGCIPKNWGMGVDFRPAVKAISSPGVRSPCIQVPKKPGTML